MTDLPDVPSFPSPTPAPPPADPSAPPPAAVGFLTVVQDAGGVVGGYLVTNGWGRPLEFRLTTGVQPNRVQAILYGPTLTGYLHADLIGKTLVDKTPTPAGLIVTDSPAALGLRDHVGVPVVAVVGDGADVPADAALVRHARCRFPLAFLERHAADRPLIEARLGAVDPAVELSEPFVRVREAIAEARKLGGSRAA